VIRTRLAATLAATAAAASVAVACLAVPAGADPIADARGRAAALARTVQDLQTRAEVATERYDAIEARLGAAVTARMLAQRDLEAAQQGTAAAQSMSEDRVRALYESGGPTTLLATVLDGSDLTDALARYHDVSLILGTDRTRVNDQATRQENATLVAARLSHAADQVTSLQAAAAAAAERVRSLLAAGQQALDAANSDVRRLVAQAQAAAAAASAASFQQALLAAGGSLTADMTPPNPTVATMLAAAKSKLGDPYLWGGTGPDAFDCSGLTQFAYAAAGIALPRVAADQWNVGAKVDLGSLLPGDLLFWASDPADPASIHHVAIYLGGGMMLAAPHTGDVVKVQPVYMDGYFGATRPWQPS
jgi:cell wall-associated NlpC family hydrolase